MTTVAVSLKHYYSSYLLRFASFGNYVSSEQVAPVTYKQLCNLNIHAGASFSHTRTILTVNVLF